MSLERNPYHTKRVPDPTYMSELVDYNNNTKKFNESISNNILLQRRQISIMSGVEALLKELINLTKLQRPRGKPAAFRFTITAGANARLVHLDFITGTKDSRNIPAGASTSFSFEKLYSITITNEGPDAVLYSLNVDKSSGEVIGRLGANESTPQYNYQFPTFETVNIALDSGATTGATIQINGLY